MEMHHKTLRGNGIETGARPTVIVTPKRSAVSQEGGKVDVLIRVQAPPAPAIQARRKALHLALVVDRSSSMSGQPLREALRCAEYIVTHLSPDDKATIVIYDDKVDTLVPLSPAREKERFVQALRRVEVRGSTALHAGWLKGAELLAPDAESASLSRVLLLSDGQANQGLIDPEAIAAQCGALAAAGVTTTTVGLGHGFNEDLMTAMARQGGGQSYYGQTAEDLHDKFEEELSLVQSLYARQLTAQLIPGPGVIIEVRSVVGATADAPVPLSDLSYGAEVFLLLRLHLTAKPAGSHALLSIVVKGDLLEGGAFEASPVLLELPALPKSVVSSLPKDELVQRRITEIETANLLDGVRVALRRRDRPAAERLLGEARTVAAENEWARETVAALERLLSEDEELTTKELAYKSGKFRARQTSQQEYCSIAADPEEPAYLRRVTEEGKKK